MPKDENLMERENHLQEPDTIIVPRTHKRCMYVRVHAHAAIILLLVYIYICIYAHMYVLVCVCVWGMILFTK